MVDDAAMGAGGPADARTKWSFARVVQLMYEKERTGILEVSGADGEWEMHLRDGQIVNALAVEGGRWLLGDMLLASETLTENQLMRALKRHKRTGERLGTVLVAMGFISRDVLKKYLELQVRETLYPLFQKIGITARFRDEPPVPLEEITPIPIPYVLKDAGRRIREWPLLEKRVPSADAVFAKAPGTIREILGTQGGGVREVDPNLPVDEEAALEGEIGGNERIVYYYVNGRKTVGQIAMASSLGAFETTKALYRLAGQGYVRMVAEEGEGERKKEETIFPLLFQIAFYVFLGAVVGLLVFWRIGGLAGAAGGIGPMTAVELQPVLLAPQSERVRLALEVYHAEAGVFPEHLDALVTEGLLEARDLRSEALGGDVSYLRLGGGDRYVLRIGERAASPEAAADLAR